jgi:hypothetical protein
MMIKLDFILRSAIVNVGLILTYKASIMSAMESKLEDHKILSRESYG